MLSMELFILNLVNNLLVFIIYASIFSFVGGSEHMGRRVEIALFCFTTVVWIQHTLSGENTHFQKSMSILHLFVCRQSGFSRQTLPI